MRWLALVVVVAMVSPSIARADEPVLERVHTQRGTLTGVGFAMLIASTASFGLMFAGLMNASASAPFVTQFGVPNTTNVMEYAALESARNTGNVLAAVGGIAGSAMLITSIIMLVADRPAPVTVGFAPTTQGAAFSFSARF